ncbi:MAG: sodium-translocating pyrophosphatase [Bacillota bacterium]|nr:sodium-translocating pyrophosphatase [Bacillota bacterium]
MGSLVFLAPIAGVLALCFAIYLISRITKMDEGSERMKEIAAAIHSGAMAFLKRQYRTLIIFVLIIIVIISVIGLVTTGEGSLKPETAIAFAVGAFCSILAGNIGMRIATRANVRTANAAYTSGLNKALNCAFSGGAVMGMSVVGLGLLGLGVVVLIFNNDSSIINGFSFGASSVALFGRVGGGIYTKAADVGADLVGKVEAGIPEDDPRNPATVADNVGDNVGDVAGMGSDLFESYVGSLIAAIALGSSLGIGANGEGMLAPLMIAAIGIVASILGTFFVSAKEGGNPQKSLNRGNIIATALAIIGIFVVCFTVLQSGYSVENAAGVLKTYSWLGVFGATVAGLLVGYLIGNVTEYYTSAQYKPVQKIAKSCETGTATNVIAGVATGMGSTAIPIILVVIGIIAAYQFAGLYGIAMAAVGMLSTTGMVVAVDAYGPISDNAGGIAEMSKLPHEVREITDKLDSVGNTTAAIGKGFAIGSAALTALALFTAYTQAVGIKSINILDPVVIVGLFIGGMLPFLFCSLTMNSVGRAAQSMIEEVRRQFREIAGLLEGKEGVKADYARCVDISCKAALKEMILPSVMAVLVPIFVGLVLGPECLGGVLCGTLVTGFLLAIFLANSGGAWDNAKKYIEEGHYGGKGSPAHEAGVNGDTIGDPFKDTSGPSLNILIKLMTIIALVFAPIFM